ncbi:MAG: epimerase [Flavobacteriaceae bacterium]
MKKVIITGSTGMVGKGVLLECLDHPNIEKALVVNRNALGLEHPKLQEILLADFTQISILSEQLKGYDACFFCMGISAVGMSEEKYTVITYETVRNFAKVLFKLNPQMTFNYVSGTGTDSSEQGRTMWARVKGKAENTVLGMGFQDAYAFRPGMIIPERGIKSRTGWYNAVYILLRPFFGMLKKSPNITTTTRIGLAMINTLYYPMKLKHLENKDINRLAYKA